MDFQVFTPLWRFYRVYLLIFGWFSGVKVYAFHPSQAFTARVNALMAVKLLQPLKQSFPKLLTELGMVMAVKLQQPEKHLSPKLLMALGMVMEVKVLQSEYLYIILYQRFTC